MSKEKALDISWGEVTVADTVHLRNNKPYADGLFCPKIFGPLVDFECECKKLRGPKFAGKTCTNCGVEVTRSSVRRERFGHIAFPLPVVNPLMFPMIGIVTGLTTRELSSLTSGLKKFQLQLSETGYLVFQEKPWESYVLVHVEDKDVSSEDSVFSSADLYSIVSRLDRDAMITRAEQIKNKKVVSVLTRMRDQHVDLEDLFISALPVIPPAYRPLIIDRDHVVSKSYNDLYLRILRVCTRIRKFEERGILSEVLKTQESLQLQKAVTNLFTDGSSIRNHVRKPLLSALQGKMGRIRGNLLGKRVDFSARSVISSDPALAMNELRLPFDVAYELFKPFILSKLISVYGMPFREALRQYRKKSALAKTWTKEVVKDRVVLMNRNPSLHRYSVMAFKVLLHRGKHIGVPPIVCAPFGADFDGDSCSIHLPLSDAAQEECKRMLMPSQNVIKSSNGGLNMNMSHEMVSGLFFMSDVKPSRTHIVENSITRLRQLLDMKIIKINEEIWFKHHGKQPVSTCVGRLIVGEILDCWINEPLAKESITKHLYNYVTSHSEDDIEKTLKMLSDTAFEYATISGLSVGYHDCSQMTAEKNKEFEIAREFEEKISDQISSGDISQEHADEMITRNWFDVINRMNTRFVEKYPDNPLSIMFRSHARLSKTQFSQILIAKGVFTNARGNVSKRPITQSYAEGLSPHSYYISTSAAHKAMADKKFITPTGGYLANQLVSACRELLITQYDCGTNLGIEVSPDLAVGRFDTKGNVITEVPPTSVIIRSPITCQSTTGICQKCYGQDVSTGRIASLNMRVGLIAAQSVSEPTTQLSMKSKHTSGAANIKGSNSVLAPIDGNFTVCSDSKNFSTLTVDDYQYVLPKKNLKVTVQTGQVKAGDVIAEYLEGVNATDISGTLPRLFKLFNAAVPEPAGIYSPVSGIVRLVPDNETCEIEIFVGETKVGKTDKLISKAQGEYVREGDVIVKGNLDVQKLFSATGDISRTGEIWTTFISEVYANEGIFIKPIHFEMIFRAMTDLVIDADGNYAVRSRGYKGTLCVNGVSKVSKIYPSWLKSLGFGYAKSRLEKAVLEMETSLGCPTELIMTGALMPQVTEEWKKYA